MLAERNVQLPIELPPISSCPAKGLRGTRQSTAQVSHLVQAANNQIIKVDLDELPSILTSLMLGWAGVEALEPKWLRKLII